MMITITQATLADFPTVYQFINLLEQGEFSDEKYKQSMHHAFEHNLQNADNIYLLASVVENGVKKEVGFISCQTQLLLHHGGLKIGEIQEMFVLEAYRSFGMGKQLLDEVKRIASEKGIDQLEVTSNKRRLNAHRFYEREGFGRTHEKFTCKLN